AGVRAPSRNDAAADPSSSGACWSAGRGKQLRALAESPGASPLQAGHRIPATTAFHEAADVLVPAPADTQGCCIGRRAATTPSGPRTSPVDVVGSGSALAAQLALGTTGARGPRSRSGGDGCLRGLSGLSGLTEIGECPCLDRRLGHARGNEPRAELLAASRIIEATWRGEVGFGRLDVSRLPDGLDECCLVLVLELLHGGEGDYLGRVQAAAIAYLLVDPACGVVEDRRRSHGALGVPPAIGLLPHLGDLLRRGCLP